MTRVHYWINISFRTLVKKYIQLLSLSCL